MRTLAQPYTNLDASCLYVELQQISLFGRAVCEGSAHTEAQSHEGSSSRLVRSSVYTFAMSANSCRSETRGSMVL